MSVVSRGVKDGNPVAGWDVVVKGANVVTELGDSTSVTGTIDGNSVC